MKGVPSMGVHWFQVDEMCSNVYAGMVNKCLQIYGLLYSSHF